jgi:hypothetical protein
MGYKTTAGGEFTCLGCGAIYHVTLHQTPFRDKDNAICEVCETVMDEWNSTTFKEYKLIKRPDDKPA